MAYNNGFPTPYQPNFYGLNNPYYQNTMMQQQMMQNQALMQQQNAQAQQAQQQQIQQSGFVLVRSEDEARNYPVAPGNSITFKDESRDYCYVKSMGFNQLDRPVFERYRMVKEDDAPAAQNGPVEPTQPSADKSSQYALKSDLTAIWDELDALKAKLKAPAKKTKLTEEDNSDDE